MRPSGGTAINAVIRTGGKQYNVREGSVIRVATLPDEPGSRVELRDVLLVSGNGNVTVGSPLVENAVVVAEVLEHGKGKKVVNFKFKAKTRYRRKRGHRQPYTELAVREILTDGAKSKQAEAPSRRRTRKDADEAEAPEQPEAAAATEAKAEAPTRRRAARKPAEEAKPEAEAATEKATPTRRRRSTKAVDEAKE